MRLTKILIIALLLNLCLLTGVLLACSSDCFRCHNVPEDHDHAVISQCSKCHHSHKDIPCGYDCFSCHPFGRTVLKCKKGMVIVECQQCHSRQNEQYQLLLIP